jgi:hypothetical protein
MPGRYARLERLLVNYYGVLQSLHILALVVSGLWWFQNGDLGVLALPPQGGWSAQSVHFLAATGMFDLVIAACAIFFVLRYREGRASAGILGAVALTGSVYSAVIYLYGTLRSGAWSAHLIAYSIIAAVFAPMVLLAVVFLYRRLPGDTIS